MVDIVMLVAGVGFFGLALGYGGGAFNANAAHPFENPTALSNFFQMLAIFTIGALSVGSFIE